MRKLLTSLFLFTASMNVLADTNPYLSTQGGTYRKIDNLSDYKDGNIIIVASYSDAGEGDKIRIMTTVSSTFGLFDSYEYGDFSENMPSTITLANVNSAANPYEYCAKTVSTGTGSATISLKDIEDMYFGITTIDNTNQLTRNSSLDSYSKWVLADDQERIISTIKYARYLRLLKDNNCFSNNKNGTSSTIYKKVHPLTFGSTGYATLYYANNSLLIPEGLEAYTYNIDNDGKLNKTAVTDTIPQNTAVVVKGTPNTTYELDILAKSSIEKNENNLLKGTETQTTTTSDAECRFFLLANGDNGLGFYYGADGGAAFENNAHKAYLCVPESHFTENGAKISFFSIDGNTTGAKEIESENTSSGTYYDMSGRQIANPQKGIYIKNGKKYKK